MTIEERLQIIDDLNRSTAQNLDILTRIVLDNDRRWEERFAKAEERLAKDEVRLAKDEERLAREEERTAKLDERMLQLMETMNRLANIVISHEQRLDDLEDRPQ